jgi:hypothetical protein
MTTQESAIYISSTGSFSESFYSADNVLIQEEEQPFPDSSTSVPQYKGTGVTTKDIGDQAAPASYQNLDYQQESSFCSSPSDIVYPQWPTFEEGVSALINNVSKTPLLSTHNQLAAISEADDALFDSLTQAKAFCETKFWNEELDVDDLALFLVAKVQDGTEDDSQFYSGQIEIAALKPTTSKVPVPLLDTDIESDVQCMSDTERWRGMTIRQQREGSRWEDDCLGLGGFGWTKKEVEKIKELVKAVDDTINISDLENAVDIEEMTDFSDLEWSEFHGIERRSEVSTVWLWAFSLMDGV